MLWRSQQDIQAPQSSVDLIDCAARVGLKCSGLSHYEIAMKVVWAT